MQNQAFTSDQFVSPATFEAAQAAAASATQAAQAKRAVIAERLAAKRAALLADGKPANASPEAPKPAKPGKPSTANAAKRVASKASSKPAKPTTAERDAARAEAHDDVSLARRIARGAVSAFYPGASQPFKAASDTFKPINAANAKPGPTGIGTPRQAALLLALATYSGGNIKRDGTFTRGGFRVPANLIDPKLPADRIISAQPESGCLGNCLGLTVAFVSGPTSGAAQREAVYRIDLHAAHRLISATHGDKAAGAFATLTGYKPPASKRRA